MKNVFFSLLLISLFVTTSCQEEQKQDPRYTMEVYIDSLYHAEDISREVADDKLQQWLLQDSTTMNYDFPLLSDGTINKAASIDDKLVVYSWHTDRYFYRTVVQYIADDGFHSFDYGLISYGDEEAEYVDASITTLVQLFRDDEDCTYYLTHSYGSPTTSWDNYHHQWAVYTILGDSLVAVPGMFEDDLRGSLEDRIDFHYNHFDWYVRNDDYNVTRLPQQYDTYFRTFWVPDVDEEECLTDKWYKYFFDGGRFHTTAKLVKSPLVNPVLDGYKNQVVVYCGDGLKARVDEMPDGSYRYASWRDWTKDQNPAVMLEQPDIILTGGTYDENTHMYYFYNGNYRYEIPAIDWEGRNFRRGVPYHDKIVVTYNGEHHTDFTIYYE